MLRGTRARRALRIPAADPDWGLAQKAGDDFIAVVVLHQHILPAFGVGTLDGKDHGRLRSAYWILSPCTHFASRAISSSPSPLLRWISVRTIRPLVMSRASTSMSPLLPQPHRTWIGECLGRFGGSSSIQHS